MSRAMVRGIRVCGYQMKKTLKTSRFFILLLLLAVYFYLNEEGIRNFCSSVQVKASPYIFPFLTNEWICQMFLSGGFLWVAMPLGSREEESAFIRFRCGEKCWDLGNCLAVIGMAVFYTAVLWVLSAVVLIPHLEFSVSWGKIWRTLALTDAAWQYGIQLETNAFIVEQFAPIMATALSFILQVLCISWMGLLLYVVNRQTRSVAGFYLAVAFVFLDTMLFNTFLESFYPLSPVSLVRLGNYSKAMLQYGVTLEGGISFYLIGIVCLCGAAVVLPKWRGEEV